MWAVGRLSILSRGQVALTAAKVAAPTPREAPAPRASEPEVIEGEPEATAPPVPIKNVEVVSESVSAAPEATIAPDSPQDSVLVVPPQSFLQRMVTRVKRLFRSLFGS